MSALPASLHPEDIGQCLVQLAAIAGGLANDPIAKGDVIRPLHGFRPTEEIKIGIMLDPLAEQHDQLARNKIVTHGQTRPNPIPRPLKIAR